MALTDKLTAIADAIRAKTGETGEMTLEQMPAKIYEPPYTVVEALLQDYRSGEQTSWTHPSQDGMASLYQPANAMPSWDGCVQDVCSPLR